MPLGKRRVTLKDIAEKTGYTVNTVSRALNDKSDISQAAKRRIRETADRLGYIGDSLAGSLRSGKTKTIAVVLSDISNPHLAHQVKLIELAAAQYGYNTIILNTDENPQYERRAIISAYEKRVDGILICPVQQTEDNMIFLRAAGIPFVLIGRYFESFEADAVLSDDVKAGRLAAEHLLGRGFRKILFLSAPHYISSARERLVGYQKAHAQAGLSADGALIRCAEVKTGGGKAAIEGIFEEGLDFDAIIAFSDMLAFEIKRALAELFKDKAEDIPVIGFDCVQAHLPLPFRFTSVGMDKGGWAKQAVGLLFERLQNPSPGAAREKIILDVYLTEF